MEIHRDLTTFRDEQLHTWYKIFETSKQKAWKLLFPLTSNQSDEDDLELLLQSLHLVTIPQEINNNPDSVVFGYFAPPAATEGQYHFKLLGFNLNKDDWLIEVLEGNLTTYEQFHITFDKNRPNVEWQNLIPRLEKIRYAGREPRERRFELIGEDADRQPLNISITLGNY